MSERLKRCPFCGGKARVSSEYQDYDAYVECLECEGRGTSYNTDSQSTESMEEVRAAAIAAWNRRISNDEGQDN